MTYVIFAWLINCNGILLTRNTIYYLSLIHICFIYSDFIVFLLFVDLKADCNNCFVAVLACPILTFISLLLSPFDVIVTPKYLQFVITNKKCVQYIN